MRKRISAAMGAVSRYSKEKVGSGFEKLRQSGRGFVFNVSPVTQTDAMPADLRVTFRQPGVDTRGLAWYNIHNRRLTKAKRKGE